MVIRKLDAPRRVVNPRLPSSRIYLTGTPGRCVPDGSIAERRSAEDPSPPDPTFAFEAAFGALQAELPVIGERGRVPQAGGRDAYGYALWEDINEVIRPILGRHCFSLRFRVRQDGRSVTVTAALVHRHGHREETELTLPVDATGGKNGVQAIGSSVSYGKRYTASLLLNLTTRGEDDDGTAADRVATIDADQLKRLRDQLASSGKNERRFVAYLKLDRLEDLPASRFPAALASINVGRVAS